MTKSAFRQMVTALEGLRDDRVNNIIRRFNLREELKKSQTEEKVRPKARTK